MHGPRGSWFCSELCAEVTARFIVTQERLDAIGARPPSATSPNRFFADLMAMGFQKLTTHELEQIAPSIGPWVTASGVGATDDGSENT